MEKYRKLTMDELSQRLVNSKKIMQKVDSGDFERGNINESLLKAPAEDLNTDETQIPQTRITQRPVGQVNPEKINQSKLPDNIKKAMIENPIPQISLSDDINMDFVNRTKKLMEQEGISPQKKGSVPISNKINLSSSDLEKTLTPIIENIIRKVMDEKLTQILSAQQLGAINENLVLKVGDSIFHGKITGVNNSKSKK